MRTYLILDNNIENIKKINSIVSDYNDFNFLGSYDDYETAMNHVLKESPDLVFFNIDTIFKNPFKFTQELNLINADFPVFIGLSENKTRAYEVIKNGFFDLLLTPISELDLRKTLLRIIRKIPEQSRKNICLKSYKDYQYLKTDEVMFLKADNNTTDFYMQDGTIFTSYKTLKTFENMLPTNFLRVHKSYVVNKNFVSRIQYSKFTCSLKRNDFEVPFTKTYINNIEIMNRQLSDFSFQSLN